MLHSLDHEMYVANVKDILWLDSAHAEFGFMAEAAQMTRVSFVPELPLLPFNRKFYSATHVFYKEVYEDAYAPQLRSDILLYFFSERSPPDPPPLSQLGGI